MNAITLVTKYGPQLTAIAAALNTTADARTAAGEEAKERNKSLTQLIRDFATLTHINGDNADDARAAMRIAFVGFEVKPGSIKASGNHFAGYRAMLTDEIDIDQKSVAEAQAYIASDEVKEKKAAKKVWAEHTKEWKAAQWVQFLTSQGLVVNTTADASQSDDVTDAEVRAIEAAAA